MNDSGLRALPFSLRRQPKATDRDAIAAMVTATRAFQDFEIDVAVELIDERLGKGSASGYEFVFADLDQRLIGYACFGQIPCTRGSWDLYWLAVTPDFQGNGVGAALLAAVENALRPLAARTLYIETSDAPSYTGTRRFYEKQNYQLIATLPDFYDRGDSKVIYAKNISK